MNCKKGFYKWECQQNRDNLYLRKSLFNQLNKQFIQNPLFFRVFFNHFCVCKNRNRKFMKKSLKNAALISKTIGLLSTICITAMLTFSYGFKEKADDLWKQLGIKQQDANSRIKESFLRGYLQYYGAHNIRNIATGNKKAVAQDLLNYTKRFMNTQFKTAYEKERREAKPQEPELKPIRTYEQIQKEEVSRLEKSIKETEASLKTMNDDMRKVFAPSLERDKKMLEECKKPASKTIQSIAEAEKNGRDWNLFGYKQNMKKWEEQYPENFNLLIKKRLQKMLELTANVDFNAELKGSGNRKFFVKPEYERKSREWKMAFRAGKEVTELTRSFAQQWLSELK